MFVDSGPKNFLRSLGVGVSVSMNEDLSKAYSREEIYAALHQMKPLIAPGPNIIPSIFFKKFWHIVRDSLIELVLQILSTCQFPLDLKHTFISLNPKRNPIVTAVDFHPISLCNVIYKLISKVTTIDLSLFSLLSFFKHKVLLF